MLFFRWYRSKFYFPCQDAETAISDKVQDQQRRGGQRKTYTPEHRPVNALLSDTRHLPVAAQAVLSCSAHQYLGVAHRHRLQDLLRAAAGRVAG